MKNRISTPAQFEPNPLPIHLAPLCKWRYEGTVLGHYFLGEMVLPDHEWSLEIGERKVRCELHRMLGSVTGDDREALFEAMEVDTDLEFTRVE